MKVLIIHHLQQIWSAGLKKHHGVTSEQVMVKMARFLRKTHYDRVILTLFEGSGPQAEHIHTGLSSYVDQWEDYGYAWCKDQAAEYPDDFVEGGLHSEFVYLPEWMRNLKGESVTICGAFDGECLDDLETALNALGIEFQRLEEFIF